MDALFNTTMTRVLRRLLSMCMNNITQEKIKEHLYIDFIFIAKNVFITRIISERSGNKRARVHYENEIKL